MAALKLVPAVLLVAYCTWAAATHFQEGCAATPIPDRGSTEQDRFFARYEGVRREIAGMRLVGYARAAPPNGSMFPAGYFYLAQYALAPTLLSPTGEHRYVVGDFGTNELLEAYLARTQLVVLHDFENGIVLLENPRVQ